MKNLKRFWNRVFKSSNDCWWRGPEYYDPRRKRKYAHCLRTFKDDGFDHRSLPVCKGVCKNFIEEG